MTAKKSYIRGNLYQIPCAALQTDPNQPRKYFDRVALQDLVDSVQDKGVLQPILFRVDQGGYLVIVAGERRFQAAKLAGLKKIPAILTEGKPDEIALVENLLRQDLTAIELAEALERTMKEYNYTQSQLSTIIFKAESTVSEILSLNRLPKEMRNELRNDPSVSRKTLLGITRKISERGMWSAYRKYKERISSPPKKRGPKGKRKTWIERFESRYEALTNFVGDLNIETLDKPTRKDLISRIEDWKETLDDLIGKIQSARTNDTRPTITQAPKTNGPSKKKKDRRHPGWR